MWNEDADSYWLLSPAANAPLLLTPVDTADGRPADDILVELSCPRRDMADLPEGSETFSVDFLEFGVRDFELFEACLLCARPL